MKKHENQDFIGERALFKECDSLISHCHFSDGESPLKESKDIKIIDSTFSYKYPLWYSKRIIVKDTLFENMAKSGLWYIDDILLENCKIEAPKEFRRSKNIRINKCDFLDSQETLWECSNVKIKDSSFKGDYLLMNSKDIEIDNMKLDGNYLLDGSKNITVRNSILNSKDSFWNCENVLVENSKIIGEYIGWNSKNVTFKNCEIESHQGFCYMENLKIIDCTIKNSDLIFEYSTVDALINSKVDSIKNPISGHIECEGVDELIMDDTDQSKTEIIIRK